MAHYCMGRLLLDPLVMLMLVDTAFAARVDRGPALLAEYDNTIPTQVVLVSEKLASPCSDYPFQPPQNTSTRYCFDHALEQTACAVNEAGGVQLWVMVSAATTEEGFLQYFGNKYPSSCLSALSLRRWLIFIQNDFGATHAWVRDYAPALSIEDGQPKKLLVLPYKKQTSSEELERTNDKSLVVDLALNIADQIGTIINGGVWEPGFTVEPPTIHELPYIETCFFDWGNFETDGAGVCLSTDWERTFGFCTDQANHTSLKQFLLEHAGCEHFPGDLVPFPDETRHVDIFARFVGPGKLLMTAYEKKEPVTSIESGSPTQVNIAERIANDNREDFATDDKIEKIEDLPTPKVVYKSFLGHKNDILVGYANVLMIQGTNQKVLLFPTFGDLANRRIGKKEYQKMEKKEQAAKNKWQEMLGNLKVIDIVADRMMEAGGGPHCMTKQYQFLGSGGR